MGSGADVVSAGELLKALKAGIKANKIVFSGVGKTEEELKIAINKKILLINCESESEAKIINKIAKRSNKKVSIGFRLNPDIDAKTHKKICHLFQTSMKVLRQLVFVETKHPFPDGSVTQVRGGAPHIHLDNM